MRKLNIKPPAALAITAVLLAGCVEAAPERQSPAESGAQGVELTDAEVIAAMQAKARRMAVAYPDLTLSDVVFDRGRVIACGYLRSPGKKPLAFRSLDVTPSDGDRLMPIFLGSAGAWDMPTNGELSDNARERCAKNGLVLPPASPES